MHLPSYLHVFVALWSLNAWIGKVSAFAAPAYVDLGACLPFAIVAGATITNSGPSIIDGDVALTPGSAAVGFPPGFIVGSLHINDGSAHACMINLDAAITDANGRPVDVHLNGELGGKTLLPGVYKSDGGFMITNILYLDGKSDAHAAWIFIMATSLVANSGSKVVMINYDNTKGTNVWWSCAERADIFTTAAMQGTVMAYQSIAAQNGATTGPLFANIGEVTLLSTVANSYYVYTNDTTPIFTDFDRRKNQGSAGAIAGIAAGSVIFVILAIVLVYFLCFSAAASGAYTAAGGSGAGGGAAPVSAV